MKKVNGLSVLSGDPAGCGRGGGAVAGTVGANIVGRRNPIIVAAVNGIGIKSVYIIGIRGGFAGTVHLIPYGAALFPEGGGNADKVFDLLGIRFTRIGHGPAGNAHGASTAGTSRGGETHRADAEDHQDSKKKTKDTFVHG